MTHLSSCERDIQTIFMEVIKYVDCTIVEGHRNAERQHEHWSKGRILKKDKDTKIRANWENTSPKDQVTTKDGYEKVSKHQSFPSVAVDVVPYPTMWSDNDALIELRGVIKWVQLKLMSEGKIDKFIDNGADLWKGFDKPHWQIR
jgi:hypothetical protein